jgi:hypothetical protein
MDPRETLLVLLVGLANNEYTTAHDALSDFYGWVRRLGFLPKLDALFMRDFYRRWLPKPLPALQQEVTEACVALAFTEGFDRNKLDLLKQALVRENYDNQSITPESAQVLIAKARDAYGSDDHSFDDHADISVGSEDAGVWVAGWYWLSDEDIRTSTEV